MLWRIAPRIINGDKVFWQRCTGSLLYGAAVCVSSGSGAELADFRLLHSEDLAGRELPYSAVWTPESGDTAREAEFSFPAADVTEIRLYDNPSPEDNVLAAEIVFPEWEPVRRRSARPRRYVGAGGRAGLRRLHRPAAGDGGRARGTYRSGGVFRRARCNAAAYKAHRRGRKFRLRLPALPRGRRRRCSRSTP